MVLFKASRGVRLERVYDMVKEGIIDPAKVTRSALQNAASVATVLLSTEALVTDIPEAEGDEDPHGHDHTGEYGGY